MVSKKQRIIELEASLKGEKADARMLREKGNGRERDLISLRRHAEAVEQAANLWRKTAQRSEQEVADLRILAAVLMRGDRTVQDISNAEMVSLRERFVGHRLVVQYDEARMRTTVTYASAADLEQPRIS